MIDSLTINQNKDVGGLPIAIGTSLAIEGGLGAHPDHPTGEDELATYPEIWFNLRTLFRNLHGALPKEYADRATPDAMAPELLSEIAFLQDFFNVRDQRAVFYYSLYRDTERLYPNASRRMDNTEKQKRYTQLETETLKRVIDFTEKKKPFILGFDQKISPPINRDKSVMGKSKIVIFTHIAYDLVSYKSFDKMVLLESHTGVIKKYPEWYTKYLNGKELSMIPFREDFLQVFGDSWMFAPMKKSARDDIIELAKQRHWTPVTTNDKIRYDINSLKNHLLREVLRKIMV